jgi:cytidylate kinase
MSDKSVKIEKWQAYVASHMRRRNKTPDEPVTAEPAITISRQTGAGAITLADTLAEHLNERAGKVDLHWAVFEKNLVGHVLEEHGLPQTLEDFMPEDKPNHLKEAVGDMLGTRPQDWELVRHTRETIYRLAKLGRCIIVGRGANIIASELPNVLHIRLIGALDGRVTRCESYYRIDRDEALQRIRKQDRARRNYMRAYYDADIDDAANYHMVINVDKFTTRGLVAFIGDIISTWAGS